MRINFLAKAFFIAQAFALGSAVNPLRQFFPDDRSGAGIHPVDSLQNSGSVNAEFAAQNYIIVFKSHVADAEIEKHENWLQSMHQKRSIDWHDVTNFVIKHTFNIGDLFRGYAGKLAPWLVRELQKHPDVLLVEPDQVMHVKEERTLAPWGLARISHKEKLNLVTFTRYQYDESAGEGVTAYVVDTGINTEHRDFGGRAVWGITIPTGEPDEDQNGHGTHVAGTIAGNTFGVSNKAKVVAVKVLNAEGSGLVSDIIKGIEWVYKASKNDTESISSVVNMSLGGDASVALDTAVSAAIQQGLFFALAAGNEAQDACQVSPARVSTAMTVGAMTWKDEVASFSNIGSCVDVFAPGHYVLSDWIGSDSAFMLLSGTSMASPHIAGLAAYFTALNHSLAYNPAALKAHILSAATEGLLDNVPSDTPNLLAYNQYEA
ncbi:serine protease Psp3 [Schizosaccharomyces japonicus yFS275]|uniref:Serine protease Psp3 n=1 Tax=Schizosaccharomyces japonicus (strain yFS275 / FY16936) TaxID=402676 RepID=B6K7R9_SCHJY|nr:serine protease Psp3 [Schizosaccharomyces japonicus yFS275]EEB09573.1 serine protease Psp3 [Schizosaccharomyces japonicus yFS275]